MQDHFERIRHERDNCLRVLRERYGYKELPPPDPKYGHSFPPDGEPWSDYSAQMRLRAGLPPRSEDECMWATIEALTQEGIIAWPGDATSIVAQMIWAQHQRASAIEAQRATDSEAGVVADESATAQPGRPDTSSEIAALIEALERLSTSAFTTYRKPDESIGSIEGDDGEQCFIVPHDAMFEARKALTLFRVSHE